MRRFAPLAGDHAAVLGLVLLATLGLAARAWLAATNAWPSVDGVDYLTQARELLRAKHLPFSSFPPGWPLIVAVPLLALDRGDPAAPLRAAQAANVVLGTLLPVLAFLDVRRRLGGAWALAVAALLLLLPHALILSKGDLSEMSYGCALLGACLLLGSGRRFPSGLVLGYAYLIRPEALIIVAGLSVAFLLRERRAPWTFWLGALIPVAPYLFYLRAKTGAWEISGKGLFLARAWREHPGWGMIALYGRNSAALLPMLPGLVGLPIVLLAVVGAVLRRGRWLLFLLPLAVLPLFDFRMDPRYWVPYVPFVAVGAALGAAALDARWCVRPRPAGRLAAARAGRALLLAVSLAGLGLAARDDARWVPINPESYPGLRDTGLWLRGLVGRETIVADYKPYVSFWADCRYVRTPETATASAAIEEVRRQGADFLIANVHEIHTLVPALDPLLQIPLPPELAGELTLVQLLTYDDIRQNTVIYSVNRKAEDARE